ncbi:MAG: phosphatidylserine decarboxylase [Candidatus Aminicenantales bacterium]
MKIAKEGWPFILGWSVLAVLVLSLSWRFVFCLCLGGALAFAFFFRDPKRKIPEGEHLLVSPADGRVVKIEDKASHPLFPSPVTSVSVFLSLFDVHITRSPLSAEVLKIDYSPGRFLPAYRHEAGAENEAQSLFLRGQKTDVFLRQIVGVAARRIKCYVKEKDRVKRGQKIGLMYFGSRVEVYFPSSVRLWVGLGQKVKAGETILGEVVR